MLKCIFGKKRDKAIGSTENPIDATPENSIEETTNDNQDETSNDEVKIDTVLKKIHHFFKKVDFKSFCLCALISWILVFVVEFLARLSLIDTLKFMTVNINCYLMNFSIVLCFVTSALFFKRRYFVMMLVIVVWLGLGIGNCVILILRNTPLTWIDFSILEDAVGMMDIYITKWQMVGIYAFIGLGVLLIVLTFIFMPKKKPHYISAIVSQSIAVLFCVITMACSYHIYKNPESFTNVPKAYERYGFVYGFSCSTIHRGVEKTENYSENTVGAIVDKISKADPETNASVKPNIIYVQLESFFDVKYLKNVQFNKDPVPTFTKLKNENPSGFLKIPGLGGGTANSEFEVLTGMNVSMFGTCEYPYKTIMREQTAGSVCYDLKKYGYATHAVHNHTATFYDRHIIYTHLGFDTFTSVEYMEDVQRTPSGWAKDAIIKDEIIKCLEATEERDFVFAVSVQSHGKYPEKPYNVKQPVKITGGIKDEVRKVGLEYYINQLYEMDQFVNSLVSTMQNYNEPTVIVFYGDHLPAINFEESQLENADLYETEYVIWSNYTLPKVEDEYLYAYQLNSRATELIGIKGNYINSLHRYYKNDKNNKKYRNELQTLIYDELYGERYAYDGLTPYYKTEMTYGPNPNNPLVRNQETGEISNLYKVETPKSDGEEPKEEVQNEE